MENILFDPESIQPLRWQLFLQTDLGKLYQAIPFKQLAPLFRQKKAIGRTPWFKTEGGIGLMVLKAYLNLSDAKLLNRLNTDWAMQLFCGIRLKEGQVIKDKHIISRWRRFLAKHLDIDLFQEQLANYWRPVLKHKHMVLMDATCYESYVRYPTDVKLVWESVEWTHKLVKSICKQHKIRRPRYKIKSLKQRVLSFQKSRKKTHKQRLRIHRSLCYLLNKLLGLIYEMIENQNVIIPKRDKHKLQVIQNVYEQQQYRFKDKSRFDKIKGRIVSTYKPYLHPIVRGKETKRVEFGAKVHTFQIDGINFVDLISFSAFNESTRMNDAIWKTQKLMRTKVHQLGGDNIYGTNKNRRSCNSGQIATCFVPKGRTSKLEPQARILRSVIAKARATVMEGAFGNEKNHYGLNKIKARTEPTEVLWIFFGIMTANMVNIARRTHKKACKPGKKIA